MLPGWFIYGNLIVFSLLIGSFINVCIYRLPLNRSIVFPSSHCTNCRSILKPADLVPVFSFLFFRGRCRYCRSGISWRYPLIEILTAVLIILNYHFFGFSLKFVVNTFISCLFIVVTFIDFDFQIIPDEITLGGLAAALLFQIGISVLAPELQEHFYSAGAVGAMLGALSGGGLLYLIAAVSRGGMGGGDVKLAAMLGALYGVKIIMIALFLSFIFGGLIGALLLLFRIKGRKDFIPFGPYICLGTLVTLFAGTDRLIDAYQVLPEMLGL
ncbi:MAG: prepilin peptidase [Candidatus Wallbacteria bacterium]|nr:prepilin peptidase [Candidatus Wallbacteria bacterium]